jgi:hypothetical protein
MEYKSLTPLLTSPSLRMNKGSDKLILQINISYLWRTGQAGSYRRSSSTVEFVKA